MTQRSPVAARTLAVTALVCGFVAVVVLVGGSIGEGGGARHHAHPQRHARARREIPAAYVIQNGDTLTSIARKTGVSVARIQRLNHGIDPQILISGEKLRLR